MNKAANSNEIQVVRHWGDSSLADKVPTLLEYPSDDPSNTAKPVAWGFGCNPYTMDGVSRVVENFRDDIMRQDAYQQSMAKRYVRDYLELLYGNLRKLFEAIVLNGKDWDEAIIQFVFSVPIYWDGRSIALFVRLVDIAGFGRQSHFDVASITDEDTAVMKHAVDCERIKVKPH